MPATKINKEHTWVLDKLQGVGYQSAIIAGGAVRDTYFSKYISDIDIYYWHSDHNKTERIITDYARIERSPVELHSLLKLDCRISTSIYSSAPPSDDATVIYDIARGGKKKTSASGSISCYGNRHVISIINVTKDAQRYQLIALDILPEEYVKTYFDVNLCRCWCDGTRLRYTDKFLVDAKTRTITISGALTKREYQYAITYHIPKLRRKFKDFTVNDTLHTKYGKKP